MKTETKLKRHAEIATNFANVCRQSAPSTDSLTCTQCALRSLRYDCVYVCSKRTLITLYKSALLSQRTLRDVVYVYDHASAGLIRDTLYAGDK